MRIRYVLDEAADRAANRAADRATRGTDRGDGSRDDRRPRPWVRAGLLLIIAALGALGSWWALQAWRTPAADTAVSGGAAVPEHQRSGPLANPWGNAAPVLLTPVEEAAARAAAASAAMESASASASAVAAARSSHAGTVGAPRAPLPPPTREAMQQALARLRGGDEGLVAGREAAAFVRTALEGDDAAALVAAWMVERQCRQLMHWRRIDEWRQRAQAQRAPAGPGPGAALVPLCAAMPEPAAVDAALAAAGIAHADGAELTRRPIDLAQAVAVGDPLLLAEVIDATGGELMLQLLRAYGADPRDVAAPEVVRSALWLASCWPVDAAGRPAGGGPLRRACAEHPALAQACLHNGLCEVRDLRELLLRSMPAAELATTERLARWLAPRMGR